MQRNEEGLPAFLFQEAINNAASSLRIQLFCAARENKV